MDSLKMLVIADPHYVHRTGRECTVPSRLGRYGLEFMKRAVAGASRTAPPDVLVLLGDMVDEGNAPGAVQDLEELTAAAREADIPVIVVPGNHDRDANTLLKAFGDKVGVHDIRGYRLYTFADPYAPDDSTTRPDADINTFEKKAAGRNVIALQHNPIYPDVPPEQAAVYPYMPINKQAIMASYEHANVILSLSGHYHEGMAPAERNGVHYLTCGSLTESPFVFNIVTLRGRQVAVEPRQLAMPKGTALTDGHTHTHFGYCAVDVHPVKSLERAKALGVKTIACVEHAGQLYLSQDGYWNRDHVNRPRVIQEARDQGQDRMEAYRNAMSEFRSDEVRVGLEVEADKDGNLNLLDEDRDGWDVILGAVHWLPGNVPQKTPEQCRESYLKIVEQLAPQGIDVLAHPLRFFYQNQMPRPAEIYRPMAGLLAEHNVAAEINYHNNQPDPDFFRICLEEGVRILLGSDAHSIIEVADLQPHLRLLQQIGLSPKDLGG